MEDPRYENVAALGPEYIGWTLVANEQSGPRRCACGNRAEPLQLPRAGADVPGGEGAYTQIPERSHALFPVAHYEFIWAHQLWNLTPSSDKYFQFYLDHYVMQNGIPSTTPRNRWRRRSARA